MSAIISFVINFVKFSLFISEVDKATPVIEKTVSQWEDIISRVKELLGIN